MPWSLTGSPANAIDSNGHRWNQQSTLIPILGMLVAVGIIVSRRPEAILHAQFWAEDGTIYFADVYNLGVRETILLPQAGYFQTFPVLAAWLARFAPLAHAPLVMGTLGLFMQVLPVGLLLSRRATTLAPDIRVRVVLAFVYLVVPYQSELDATAVNSQWTLAISGFLVLMLAPPRRRIWRWLDGGILLIAGVTGPFSLLLAPIAWIRRRTRGSEFVPGWEVALLLACAVVQALSILVISRHDATHLGVEARPSPHLGATLTLFAKLVGGRLFLGTIIGDAHGLTAPLAIQWIALILGLVALALVVRFGRQELVLFVVLAAGVLAGGLVRPSTPTPAWPILASVPVNAQRYFYLAELAILAALIWLAAAAVVRFARIGAVALVTVSLVIAISGHWLFPALPRTDLARQAAAFIAHLMALSRLSPSIRRRGR